MATAQQNVSDPEPQVLTPELKAFIDGAIVPALVKAWLAENRHQNTLASIVDGVDNSPRQLSAEQGVTT